jgi:hypothetical protein
MKKRAKKKPAVEAGLNPILSEESWRRQKQYAALQNIGPIFVWHIRYKQQTYLLRN